MLLLKRLLYPILWLNVASSINAGRFLKADGLIRVHKASCDAALINMPGTGYSGSSPGAFMIGASAQDAKDMVSGAYNNLTKPVDPGRVDEVLSGLVTSSSKYIARAESLVLGNFLIHQASLSRITDIIEDALQRFLRQYDHTPVKVFCGVGPDVLVEEKVGRFKQKMQAGNAWPN